MKKLDIVLETILLIAAGLYLNNASWLAPAPEGAPMLYSHRGVHQPYDREGLTNDTCTAERMIRADHDFIENKIPSMKAAFATGADIFEIDIYETRDGQWAVYHDFELGCRTETQGRIRDFTMDNSNSWMSAMVIPPMAAPAFLSGGGTLAPCPLWKMC